MSEQQTRGIEAIKKTFSVRISAGGRVFVPYIVAGDPDAETSLEIAVSLCEAGADILELGMPFSDPLADGPVNQRGAERALKAGMTFPGLLNIARKLRSTGISTPLICMTYVNPILKRGYAKVAAEAAEAGLDGFIVVDLPPEEAGGLQNELAAKNLALVYLLAPTSTDARVRLVTSAASGFLYYVSRTGVTGARDDISADLQENLDRIKAVTDLPVVVGFGIKTPEQAVQVASHADGAVVGSALVQHLESLPKTDMPVRAAEFIAPLVEAVHASEAVAGGRR